MTTEIWDMLIDKGLPTVLLGLGLYFTKKFYDNKIADTKAANDKHLADIKKLHKDVSERLNQELADSKAFNIKVIEDFIELMIKVEEKLPDKEQWKIQYSQIIEMLEEIKKMNSKSN